MMRYTKHIAWIIMLIAGMGQLQATDPPGGSYSLDVPEGSYYIQPESATVYWEAGKATGDSHNGTPGVKSGNRLEGETVTILFDRTRWNVNYRSKTVFSDLTDGFIRDEFQVRVTIDATL